MIALTHLKTIQQSQSCQFNAKDSHSVYNLAEANLALAICFLLLFFFLFFLIVWQGRRHRGCEVGNSESKLQEKEARASYTNLLRFRDA